MIYLTHLCHHNAFSLCDVLVNRVDIGNLLWVVIAVIVANKELPSVVRKHKNGSTTWKHCCRSWWKHDCIQWVILCNMQDLAAQYYKNNWIQPYAFCILLYWLTIIDTYMCEVILHLIYTFIYQEKLKWVVLKTRYYLWSWPILNCCD